MKRNVLKTLLAGLLVLCLLLASSCGVASVVGSKTESADGSASATETYTAASVSTAADAEADKVAITGDFTVTTDVKRLRAVRQRLHDHVRR